MNIKIKVTNWKLKSGKIQGEYAVIANNEEVATQKFNSDYDSRDFSFSADLRDQAVELGKKIEVEVQQTFS